MVDNSMWPTGIRPKNNGIEVRVRRKGYNYVKQFPGDPNKKSVIAAAVRHHREINSRIDLGLPVYAEERTKVTTFFDDVERYISTASIQHSTAEEYLRNLKKYWLPVFGNHITQEIRTVDIELVVSTWSVTRGTIKNRLNPLIKVFEKAKVIPNPVNGLEIPEQEISNNKNQMKRFLPKQRAAIMKALEKHDDPQVPAYFALLFGAGLRPRGEPLGLQWTDYDGKEVYIHQTIVRRKFKPSTKTRIARRVYVPSWVRPYLDNLPSRFNDGHLFLNTRGNPYLAPDTFNNAWREVFSQKTIRREFKLTYQRPYVCRHTRAAELLSTGVAPGDCARQLGHTLAVFFRIYSEWIEKWAGETDETRFEGYSKKNGPKLGLISENE